ncbi:uncharacterized protein LOC111122399 isoform X1 [Crassostrea virginica]
MNSVILILCFSLFLLAIQIPSTKGSFCTKVGSYYAAQRICVIPYIILFYVGCSYYGYRRIVVYERYRQCCPGYKGKDCTTPICQEKCSPGFICSYPDMCTVDPMAANVLYTNSTSTHISDVGVTPTAADTNE